MSEVAGDLAPAPETTPASPPAEVPQDIPAPQETAPDEPLLEDGDDAPVEEDDLEFGFKKYRVPKTLKTDIEKWRGETTRKEQSIAEERKALETQRVEQAKTSKEALLKRGHMTYAEDMITRHNAEIARLQTEGYVDDANALRFQLMDWERLHKDLSKDIAEHEAKSTQEAQQATAKRQQEAREAIARDIPNWEAIKLKVAEFAVKELGYSIEALSNMTDPAQGKALHLAMIGHQFIAKQATAKAAPQTPAVVEQPITQVASRNSGTAARKSLADLAKDVDASAYIAARKAQEKASA